MDHLFGHGAGTVLVALGLVVLCIGRVCAINPYLSQAVRVAALALPGPSLSLRLVGGMRPGGTGSSGKFLQAVPLLSWNVGARR
jgi:hypothetical protein